MDNNTSVFVAKWKGFTRFGKDVCVSVSCFGLLYSINENNGNNGAFILVQME